MIYKFVDDMKIGGVVDSEEGKFTLQSDVAMLVTPVR